MPSAQPARCYRHPDREAFVVCQRCGRPICPDCMRPAAVGFHCPEEGNAARQAPRAALGGRLENAGSGLVTKIIIGLCVVGYVLEGVPSSLFGSTRPNQFTIDYSMIPYAIAYNHEYYRLLTPAFLHANFLHILMNMYALFLLGSALETLLGRLRVAALFVICAVGGNTFSYVINGVDSNTFSVGASTAIFGFFAAYYLCARRLRLDTRQILVVVGINLLLTFGISSIDKWGHIGGLAAGVAMGLIFAYIPTRKVALQALAGAAVLAALVVTAVLYTQSVTPASPLGI